MTDERFDALVVKARDAAERSPQECYFGVFSTVLGHAVTNEHVGASKGKYEARKQRARTTSKKTKK